MTSTVLTLLVVSAGIVWVAVRMTRVADRIAETTGLSRGFVGMLLLAVATSLPELTTSLLAVLVYGAPGLAFGNVFGSNVANLAFVGLLDLMIAGSIFAHALREHAINAIWTVVLTAMAVGAILTERWLGGAPLQCAKMFTVCILAAYPIALHWGRTGDESRRPSKADGSLRLWLQFVGCALLILGLGLLLTRSCDELARISGLGHTFIGTLVLALVTSLPELVVYIESVRLGSIDMAFGNLIGSNLFNVTILGICDLTYLRSSIYAVPEAMASLPAAAIGCVMIVLIGVGVWIQQKWAIGGRVSPISVLLILAYLVSNILTYLS